MSNNESAQARNKRSIRGYLDAVTNAYNTNTTKKLTESQIVTEGEDFTNALKERIVNDPDFQNGEVHQAILNVAYDDWQNDAFDGGYESMVHYAKEQYGDLAAFAILAGKHNQQVENGGHMQYFDNGYAGGENNFGRNRSEDDTELHNLMIELANKYGIGNMGSAGAKALEIYNAFEVAPQNCDECGGHGSHDEDCSACDASGYVEDPEDEGSDGMECPDCDGRGYTEETCHSCDGTGDGELVGGPSSLDDRYYEFNNEYMELLNQFFAGKLNKTADDGPRVPRRESVEEDYDDWNDNFVELHRRGEGIWEFENTRDAYDACQTQEEMNDGEILLIPSEGVVGIVHTWPFAVTETSGSLHTLTNYNDPPEGVTLEDLKAAYDMAREMGYSLHPDVTIGEAYDYVEETSTAGASSAGNVAGLAGGLGAGDPKASIYYSNKGSKKKKSKKTDIIRRPRT